MAGRKREKNRSIFGPLLFRFPRRSAQDRRFAEAPWPEQEKPPLCVDCAPYIAQFIFSADELAWFQFGAILERVANWYSTIRTVLQGRSH